METLAIDPAFRAITGNIVFPGFTAPKLVWVARNEPDIFARTRKVLLPKDYLRLWLTGEYVSDMSDSAGTSWLDTGARKWSSELLAKTSLTEDHMPKLAEGSDATGTLRAELTARWGLTNAPVVAGGAGDNAASACGMGTVQPGHAFVSLGTSGVLFAANGAYQPKPESAVHAFCHALPGTWHQMGVILSAASALDWFSRIVEATPHALDTELGDTLKAPGSVTFLPYLSGERTPYNDAKIRGVFSGLEHETDRNAMTQAVLEGVAFAIRDNLVALQSAGTEIDHTAGDVHGRKEENGRFGCPALGYNPCSNHRRHHRRLEHETHLRLLHRRTVLRRHSGFPTRKAAVFYLTAELPPSA